MKLTTEQITKLKVTEIRDELKLRGLDQSGTKALLISRLIANVEKEAADEKAGTLTEAPAAEASSFGQKTEQTKSEKSEKVPTAAEEDGEIKPKHKPIVYNIPLKDASAVKADEEVKKKRRAERFGIVDVAEQEAKKLKARSERFNLKLPETEAAKLEQRAKRFAQPEGTASVQKKDSKGHIDLSHIVTSATMTEDEKKKRRAERFGVANN